MNRRKNISITLSIFILLAAGISALSQGPQERPIEQSYDVILQVMIGGDKAQGQSIPQNLGAVARMLKANYSFTDYRLANTFVGRIANNGTFEFKSVSNIFGSNSESETPSFLELSISGLRSGSNQAGKTVLVLERFRFGARIPIKTAVFSDGAKLAPVVNYESIGLTSARVTLAENSPTLLGSLSLPAADNSMFLVLTLRPA
ncbi:MAG: hypothetical protein ACRD6X_15680 [Pyrinomonadaceae bacterium]